MLNWCLFSRSELEELLGTDLERGISSSVALLRSAEKEAAQSELREFFYPFTTFLRILGGIISEFSFLMLIVSALICEVFVGTGSSAFNIIIGFIFCCAILRTVLLLVCEYACREKMSEDSFKVLRDGKIKYVKASSLVRGDVVYVVKGDIIPCDMRLVESENLSVIEKYSGNRLKPQGKEAVYFQKNMSDASLRLKKNMLFEGSALTSGSGVAVVIDKKMTPSQAKKIVNISDEAIHLYIDKNKNSAPFLKLSGRNAFGIEFGRHTEYAEEKSPVEESEKLSSLMRSAALVAGTLIFVFALVSKVQVAKALLLATLVMACAPKALYETVVESVFVVGCIRLLRQGVKLKNFESAEKLSAVKSILCSGAAAYSIDKMIPQVCYIGRSINFSAENVNSIRNFTELLLCVSELKYKTDKNGNRSISGNIEGKAVLDAARRMGIVQPGKEKSFIKRISEFYDINGTLYGSFCSFKGQRLLITKGSVSSEIKKCTHWDNMGANPEKLDDAMRERIIENAKAYENNESCRVVALCYKACETVKRNDLRNGFVFAGFVVFGTKVNYGSAKYVELLRKNEITPVIFANVASDMALNDAKKIGVLSPGDNYITSKSFSSLDEKIYSDDLDSYTLYLGLGGLQKRAVVRNKKYSEKLVAVATDKPGDAFDMSEADVLVSFGTDAPKTLRRISDIHSNKAGIDVIYRTICICRNMMRSLALSVQYLICSQVATLLFFIFGMMLSAFFTGGVTVMEMPQMCSIIFVTDFVIALLVSMIKTPLSIISDTPKGFREYFSLSKILPKAVLSGVLCAASAFLALLFGIFLQRTPVAGASCAFAVLYVSKCLVSVFCIMTTGTKKATARFPLFAFVTELVLGVMFAAFFGQSAFPFGYGIKLAAICASLSLIPALLTVIYQKIDKTK